MMLKFHLTSSAITREIPGRSSALIRGVGRGCAYVAAGAHNRPAAIYAHHAPNATGYRPAPSRGLAHDPHLPSIRCTPPVFLYESHNRRKETLFLTADQRVTGNKTKVLKNKDRIIRYLFYIWAKIQDLFSKACEYGIRAVILISNKSLGDQRISMKDIAKEINSPEAFTAKILQQLVRAGVLSSIKGPNGGFYIERERIDQIKLSEVVAAIDGDSIYVGCGLGLSECSEDFPCPLHYKFKKVRDDLRNMLEVTSLYELATGFDMGLTYLKRI